MKKLTPVLALVAAAAACRPAPKMNESQEYYMGRGVAAHSIEKTGIYENPALEEYVTLVGLTVALESDRPETFKGYTFAILNSDSINAFAGPSGFIFITKGALRAMRNEDELAGVLAHEIGHVCLRHPEIAAQAAADGAGLGDAIGVLGGALGLFFQAKGQTDKAETVKKATPAFGQAIQSVNEKFQLGYGREEEFAADAMAVDFVTREGVRYDPNAFKDFISRLPKTKTAYGTHPDLDGRIQAIEAEIRKRKPASVDPARTARFLEAMKLIR
jgi:predicted Zn-dependent protease